MKKYSFIMLALSLITLVLSACGGKGPLPPADTTSPAISLTSPTNGEQNVAVNSSIAIKFSEAADASTINEQTVTLSTGTGNVPGSVIYSDTTAVFKPASSLNPGTIYTVAVDGVRDVAGNTMVTPFSYIFITGTALVSTTISLSAPGVTYNTDGIVTITVSSGGSIPIGSVSLSVDGGTAVVKDLTVGSTAFTIPSPSAGSHTLYAAYAAQGIFGASSADGALLVNQATTTTTITAPAATYGANGSVTVTVSAGTLIPTGNVSLIVDNGTPLTQSLISGCTTFMIPSPSIGSHTLSATYAAQGNFGASSAPGTLGVGPATNMTLTAPGITYGINGSVTVKVSSAAGTPTGTVSLSVDGGSATMQPLDSNGSTAFTIPSPSAGPHTLYAAYAAQGNFEASSADGTLLVNQAATMTTITAPAVAYGADGSVTVTVSAETLIPTGNVSLIVDGGTPLTQSLINGSTTFTIPSPSIGSHTLSATYAAQGNFGASSSVPGTLGVGPGATTMTLTAPAVTYGTNGIVTVTVSSAAGTPTGNVSLSVDGGTATTQGLINGSTAFTIPRPSAGSHTLYAAYAAQGNFEASVASDALIVSQASTSTQVTSSLNPSTFGVFVTLTASVTPSMATGTVTFKDYTTVIGTGALSGGVATFRTSLFTGGVHSLTAEYGGDTNFPASTSTALLQTVNYAITATAGPHGHINPSGTVSVSSGAVQTFTIKPDSKRTIEDVRVDGVSQGRVASYTFTNVTANHTIDATFN